jgi:hypothetical protein
VARSHANRAGVIAIPTYERIETAWPIARVPAWFHAVPQKPAWRWTDRAGRTAPHYAELIVRDLLERDDWHAVWVKNFGGREFWTELGPRGRVAVVLPPREARLIAEIDAMVRAHAPGTNRSGPPGGCWDTFAWRRGPRYLFLETKKPGESFKPSQEVWLAASLAVGVPFEAFAVVQYRSG